MWDIRHKKLQKVITGTAAHLTSLCPSVAVLLCTKRMTAGLFLVGASQHLRAVREETHLLSCRGEKGSQTSCNFVSSTTVCSEYVKRHGSS